MLTLKQLAQKIGGTFHGKDMPKPNISIDTRTLKKGDMYVAIKGPRFDGHQFIKDAIKKGASCIMTQSPACTKVPEIVVPNTTEALGKMASIWRNQFKIPLIGITGSCGKTGTKEMLAAILSEVGNTLFTQGNFNNSFGLPLTLLKLDDSHQFAVIEMGTSAPGEIAHLVNLAQPTVSMITNIGASHIENFGSLKAIAREKSEIYAGLSEDGIAIVNHEEPFATDWEDRIEHRHRVSFGTNDEADVYLQNLHASASGVTFDLHTPIGVGACKIPLLGEHVATNAVAAAAAAMAVGTKIEAVTAGLSKVKPVKGRMMPFELENGATLIDDTYNASATAVGNAIKFLSSVPGKKIFVMSNMAEMGPDSDKYHKQMGELIASGNIDVALLTGNKTWLAPALKAAGKVATYYENQKELVKALRPEITSDSVILVKGCRSCHMENIVEAIREEECYQ